MKKLLATLLFLFLLSPLLGTDYYVKNGGNDGADGSDDANAWETIVKVEAIAGANDTVYFKRGDVWREQLDVPDNTMTFDAYDAGANPLILGSIETVGLTWTHEGSDIWSATLTTQCYMVVFDSTNMGVEDASPDANYEWDWVSNEIFVYAESDPDGYYSSIEASQRGYGIYASSKSNVNIKNIDAKYTRYDGMNVDTGSNFYFENCEISYTGHSGLSGYEVASFHANNCTIHHCGAEGYEWYPHGIYWTHLGGAGGTIENCEVYSNLIGHGIKFKQAIGGIIRYNLCYDNTWSGIEVGQISGSDCDTYYNICYQNGQHGISIGADIGDTGTGNTVYNNVLYDNGNMGMDVFLAGTTIKNNVFLNNDSREVYFESSAHATATSDYNCFYGAGNIWYWNGTDYTTADFAAYKAASSQDANSLYADPLVINAAGFDFRLLMASPCINAGTDVGLTRDYRGRSIRHAPDIGAYEDPTNVLFMTKLFNYIMDKRKENERN